ncbi:MAG: DUF3795 domain-containing protein [Clostridia bacterium]|nr:DUF3795 domain-containing protein [Clostridia bacterium]
MSTDINACKKALGEFIAYCGVNCELCHDYKNEVCPSCRKTVWADGDECMPVACCRDNGIDFCGECERFPCPDMKEFYRESESHEFAYERMKALNEAK